jgi:chromatin remodeling complex protein RSC6
MTQPEREDDGAPLVDPTKNVLQLVEAAIQRQDDLRAAESRALREKVAALEKVIDARLDSHDKEFSLVESRRVEQKVDTKVAVDAALSAAEKAVKEQTVASEKSIIKSETSAAEQSKQQNATFTAALKGVTDTVGDLKERLGKVEARVISNAEARTNQRLDLNLVIAAIVVAVAIYAAFH